MTAAISAAAVVGCCVTLLMLYGAGLLHTLPARCVVHYSSKLAPVIQTPGINRPICCYSSRVVSPCNNLYHGTS